MKKLSAWDMVEYVLLALVLALIAAGIILGTAACTAPGPDDPERDCRTVAEHVFRDVMAEPARMSVEQGQAQVDEHCASVDSDLRQEIISQVRSAAIARYLSEDAS